jgi:hypothetical protein
MLRHRRWDLLSLCRVSTLTSGGLTVLGRGPSTIVFGVDQEARERLNEELRQLGPEGEKAADMLTAAAEQIERAGTRAGNLIAYGIREALMSLLDMGGERHYPMTDAVDQTIDRANKLRDGGSPEPLLEAVSELEAAWDGDGPHVKRLEALIGSLARHEPVRTKADLIDIYVELIGEVNRLHANVTVQEATGLYERALATLGRLFGRIGDRLAEIDPLTEITVPTPADVARLVSLAGDPRTLGYFYGSLDGPGWLRALADHELLQPPETGPWFAYGYLQRLAESHPEDVREWLRSRTSGSELSDHQAFLLVAVARTVPGRVADAVLHVTKDRTDDAGVLHQVAAYIGELPAEQHSDPAVISIIKRALEGAAAKDAPADVSYLTAGLLRVAVSSAGQGEARRWLGILAAKLRAACGRFPGELRVLQKIDALTLNPDSHAFDQLVATVRDVARLAADQDMPTSERIGMLATLPSPLAGRLIAEHLIETLDADVDVAFAAMTDEVAREDPMPETLALLAELAGREHPGLDPRMLDALGDPPSDEEVAALDQDEELPKPWRHAYGWLIVMPAAVREPWARANEKVEERWGPASPNGYMWPKATAFTVSRETAIGANVLAELEPREAARRLAAFTPSGKFGDATRYDASQELQQAINNDLLRWIAEPAAIIEALDDPMYAERYLNALADQVDELHEHVPDVLDAVELAEQKLTTEQTSPEPIESWANVVSSGLDLITKLAHAGAPFTRSDRDRGWGLIDRAVRRRDEDLPDEQPDVPTAHRAIYRRSMRALATAIPYADATSDGSSEPEQLLQLVDELLALDEPDGLHARAILARNLPWLASRAPEWTRSHWSLLVGADAPDGLGPGTFDQYLEAGAPFKSFLTEHRNLYLEALERAPDGARRHLLHGMLWKLDGYDPASVLEALQAAGDDQVAEAIKWLTFGAFREPDMPLEDAIEFLRLALTRELHGNVVKPIGWLARAEGLDDEAWLDLTLQAVQVANGELDQPDDVAERAAKHPDDERAIRIVAGLLNSDSQLWHLNDIAAVGLKLVNRTDPETQAVREELREQLLKREFFDAREEPDPKRKLD